MTPLLRHGDRILVFRWYPVRLLRQEQIVVLTASPKHPMRDLERSTWYVKRVVALGGETFTTDTAPYPEADAQTLKAQGDESGRWSWHTPPGHVFVCGDNRKESIDSRTWGPLPLDQVVGIMLTKLPGTSAAPPELSSRDIISYESFPIGEPAPDFCAETLNGETVTLERYHGKALLLFFIANTSLSYQKIPAYLVLAEELAAHHIEVVFAFDGTHKMAHKLTELLPPSQPVLVAPCTANPLFEDYHLVGTPSYCLLDTQHIVRATDFTRLDAATLLAVLELARPEVSQEELNAYNT